MSKAFEPPVVIDIGGRRATLRTVAEARELLSAVDWPERGPAHRNALDACLKVEDGHRSIADATEALRRAVAEAGGTLG